MKLSPEIKKVQINMKSGKITREGFLGTDTRNISDIIQADEEIFEDLSLDWNTVSEKLDFLVNEGKKGLGIPVLIDNKWIVTVTEDRGVLPCPFEDGLYKKLIIKVVCLPEKTELNFSELSIHLIKSHHFLQGRESPYRIEPKQIQRIMKS